MNGSTNVDLDWLPDGWAYADPPAGVEGVLTPYAPPDLPPVLLDVYSFRIIETVTEYTPRGAIRWFDVSLVQTRFTARRALSVWKGTWEAHPPIDWGFERDDLNAEAARMFEIAAPRLVALMRC